MQKVKLPLTIDPKKAAQKKLDYIGYFPAERASRLLESVVSLDTDINAKLSFSIDNQYLTVITGEASVMVTLACQRCNKDFKQIINAEYCFCPVKNEEQTENLPEDYEPIEVNNFGEIDLISLIEDELILALPIVPVHEVEHCEVSEADMIFGELPAQAEKPNPFAILASLKQK